MNAAKRGMSVGAPPDPLVVKYGCQFGNFSYASFHHCTERSEPGYCQEIRLNEGIRFVLAATKTSTDT